MAQSPRHGLSADSPSGPSAVRLWLIGAALLLVAAGLRIAAANNDLWLDEIWSLQLAEKVKSPWDVFTGLHHDNNHYLNTLWMWTVGPDRNPIIYRLPSLLTGTAAVAIAGVIGLRRDPATGLLASLLFAFSYVMVLYASEARGYGAVCCFSLLGYDSLERFFETRRWTAAVIFSLSCVVGVLAQPVFISFFAAAIVSSVYWLMQPLLAGRGAAAANGLASRVSTGAALTLILSLAVPLAVVLVIYVVDLRQMIIGGGAISNSLLASYAEALAWSWGVASLGLPPLVGILLAIAVAGAALHFEWLESRRRAIFFVAAIAVFPLAVAILRESNVLYPRYFIISIVFLLLLASFWLGALWRSNATGQRLAVILLLLAFLVANGLHLAALMRRGRSDTTAVLQLIVAESREKDIVVGVDHGLRIGLPATYVARSAVPGSTLYFTRNGPWSPNPPEWYICHRDSHEAPVPYSAEGLSRAGTRYRLAGEFPAAPLSGLHWFVYHRE